MIRRFLITMAVSAVVTMTLILIAGLAIASLAKEMS